MSIGTKGSRYERRSLARRRRVQRRLDQAQQARRGAGVPGRAQRLSRPARVVLFGLSLLLGLGLARAVTATAFAWLRDTPATVISIAVQGTNRLTPEEVAHNAGLGRGNPIDDLSTEQIEDELDAHPWIQHARVAVLPTGTVIVDIVERQPRAVLLRADAPALFVDSSGLAFAEVRDTNRAEAQTLPALTAGGSEPGSGSGLGDRVDLEEALALLDHLDGLALPGLTRADLPHRGLQLELPRTDESRGWVLRCQDNTDVVLGAGDSATVIERLDRLERLLSAGLGELSRTTEIDLRFAGQAVLRTEGASG